MLYIQSCAKFKSLWVKRQTPAVTSLRYGNVHTARTGEAIAIMMNNELKQEEGGEGERGLSYVNLLIDDVCVCKALFFF